MQSGRISPLIRNFFSPSITSKKNTDSETGGRNQYEQPQRQPTREEAELALSMLSGQEEFQKQGLTAVLRMEDNILIIAVSNAKGIVLRSIRGPEIVRLLEASSSAGDKSLHIGRILDRRI